jgi:hypothetical protein
MRNPYDVHIEIIKEEVLTIEAKGADEAQEKAMTWAEENIDWTEIDDVRVVAVNVNMEY